MPVFKSFSKKPHRAMLKLGSRIGSLLGHLVEKMSAVFSADRCKFLEADKAVPDQNRNCEDLIEREHYFEHFGLIRFPIPAPNWHFLIKVRTYVIGLSCLLRRNNDVHDFVFRTFLLVPYKWIIPLMSYFFGLQKCIHEIVHGSLKRIYM